MNEPASDFYVVAHEPGAENPAIPSWACRSSNPAQIGDASNLPVERVDIDSVPGAFQLLNLLSKDECRRLVELTEAFGYLEDAAVSLPRSVRHNDNAVWIADDETLQRIWQRCAPLMQDPGDSFPGRAAVGLNGRFRFYRYGPGDYFAPHTDGSWPGSRLVDGELVTNAFNDRWSMLTILLYLTDDYDGGATQFFVDASDPGRPARRDDAVKVVSIRTPIGGALCFPHGNHPQHCLHSSEEISRGRKYIIRSDVLFQV